MVRLVRPYVLPVPVGVLQVPLLAKLPPTAQTAVLRALNYAHYDPGEYIVREGVSIPSRGHEGRVRNYGIPMLDSA